MEIRRFFVTNSDISGNLVTLCGDEFLHMTKVLRYKVGYKAVILANDGVERLCTVNEISKDYATLTIDEEKVVDGKKSKLTLCAGLLKNNKLDFVVQKGVELGVDEIIPFTSSNTAESKFNRERAEKIALESAKQCGSVYLSKIGELKTFDEVVKSFSDFDEVVFAYEYEKKVKLRDLGLQSGNILLVVGAEGGFTPEEVEKATANGAKIITLGKRILRAETASIVLSALTLDNLGELDYD